MRFFWLLLTAAGVAMAFLTQSPGLMALGLFVALLGMFCAVFAFAAARIESTARPDSALLTPEVMAQIRARAQQQRETAGQPAAPPQPLPPRRPPGTP